MAKFLPLKPKVIGKFDKSKWIKIWKEIKAIPGTTSEIPDKFNMCFPVVVKKE